MRVQFTVSSHTRFLIGFLLIEFLSSFTQQQYVLEWIIHHPLVNSFVAAIGVTFHAYNTYTKPKENKDNG